jgi:hypothetical protein
MRKSLRKLSQAPASACPNFGCRCGLVSLLLILVGAGLSLLPAAGDHDKENAGSTREVDLDVGQPCELSPILHRQRSMENNGPG